MLYLCYIYYVLQVATKTSLPPVRNPNQIRNYFPINKVNIHEQKQVKSGIMALPKYHQNRIQAPRQPLVKPQFIPDFESKPQAPSKQPLNKQRLFDTTQNYQTPQIYFDHKPKLYLPETVQNFKPTQNLVKEVTNSTPVDFTKLYYNSQIKRTVLVAILALIGFTALINGFSTFIFSTSSLLFLPNSTTLLASNPFIFVTNYISNYLLLFVNYLRQFGLFTGPWTQPDFIYPLWWFIIDLGIKTGLIIYLQFYWQKWDRQNLFENGCFNSTYPYAESFENLLEETDTEEELYKEFWLATNSLRKEQGLPPISIENITGNFDSKDEEVTNQTKISPDSQINTSQLDWELYDTDLDLDNEEGFRQPIFEGVLSPVRNWFKNHNQELYGILRGFITPFITWTFAIILSLFFVLDPRNPVYILFYVLSVTSLFWLNQNITNLMDHLRWKNLRF